MIKKALIGIFLLVFGILMSGFAHAGTSIGTSQFDISIDRVAINSQVISQSRNNLVNDADQFIARVDITAVKNLENGHIEVSLRGRQSGDTVADSTGVFDLLNNTDITKTLILNLNDGLKREDNFELVVRVADARGRSEQKTYGIKTKQTIRRGIDALDVSIDRVRVNNKIVAPSRTNFIEEKDEFDITVDITALENIENAHVEAVLKDLISGKVVADSSPNFNLGDAQSSSKALRLVLLDNLRKSNSFELTILVVDAEGDSVRQTYGISMKEGALTAGKLDVSFDRVEVEDKVVVENQDNFLVTGDSTKKLDIKVSLTSNEKIENARLEAVLMFENGNVIADVTQTTFNLTPDQKFVKDLELELPGKFKQDNFQIKIRLIDSDGNSIEKLYSVRITQQKFPFVISTITLNPEDKAQAGKSLGIRVVFKNSGVLPLEGIFARANVEELGLSSTKYIDPLKNKGQELIAEEFIIRIPETAQTGTYTLKAEIGSQLDNKKETKEIQFEIAGKSGPFVVQDSTTTISVPVIKQDMANDGTEAVYKVIVTNDDFKSNSYAISLDGAGWAKLRLNEPSAFVLKAKESKTLSVYASTNENLRGEQRFFVTVKSNDRLLRQIAFKANVVPAKGFYLVQVFNLKAVLQVFLILATLALVAVGVFYGLQSVARKDKSKDVEGIASEIPQGEAYY